LFVCGAWALAGGVPGAGAFESRISAAMTPDFIRFFDTLALTADYGPFNNRPPWVRKWAGPVHIVLDPSAEPLRRQVEHIAARFSQWTDLAFTVIPPGADTATDTGNLITIELLARDAFQQTYKTRDVVCQTETHGIGGTLQVGYMVLSEGYTDCLRHEFMHALGFDSHWYPQQPSDIRSVLAYRDSAARSEDYSPWDIMAIRLLYDWRIQAGMSRQKSLMIAHEVINERPQSAALPVASNAGSTIR
jgi:Protein of unknown function (DUF2927)